MYDCCRIQNQNLACSITLVEHIRSVMDEIRYVIGIFIDLSKAFDTINHEILLEKIEYFGLSEHSIYTKLPYGFRQCVELHGL